MKAITIWQPWAEFIAAGVKHNETRSWATKYRGPIAIHAAVKPIRQVVPLLSEKAFGLMVEKLEELPEPIKAKGQQGLWSWEA